MKCDICRQEMSEETTFLFRRVRYYIMIMSESRKQYNVCKKCSREIADHIRKMIIKNNEIMRTMEDEKNGQP